MRNIAAKCMRSGPCSWCGLEGVFILLRTRAAQCALDGAQPGRAAPAGVGGGEAAGAVGPSPATRAIGFVVKAGESMCQRV